jgi:hypothetical protein
MPALPLSEIVLWTTGPILHLLCVYFLYRRKLLTQFKFFASFLAFQAVKSVVLFFCYRYSAAQSNSWLYFSAYWVSTALADMAMIPVLYEIFCGAFKPFAGLQDLAKLIFKWAAGSIIFIGLLVFVSSPGQAGPRYHWLSTVVNDFERIVRVMECALLMFLFMGSQHLGISKRNRVLGFALGFGMEAFFQLLVYSALANSHVSAIPSLTRLLPFVYYMSLLIWVGYLAQPEPTREAMHIPVTSPLLRWNEVALALGHTGGHVAINTSAEPFMPSVERMVEQVMQKEMLVERRQQRVF